VNRGRWGSGCSSVGWRVTRSNLHHLAPPAHLHAGFRFHHGSSLHITRRSNATLCQQWNRYTFARVHSYVCVRACARARPACTVYACKRVRECLSLYISLGGHTNYLFRQGVAYRSDGYWPIIRPIFGTDDRIWDLCFASIFFSFLVSLPLVSALLTHAIHAYAREIRCNNARIPLLANISIRDIGIAHIALSEARSSIGINELIETWKITYLRKYPNLGSFSLIYRAAKQF